VTYTCALVGSWRSTEAHLTVLFLFGTGKERCNAVQRAVEMLVAWDGMCVTVAEALFCSTAIEMTIVLYCFLHCYSSNKSERERERERESTNTHSACASLL